MPAVDLHCHLLPGVDDGADTMEESVAYARDAAARGTRRIVATPHVELVEVVELPERVAELRAALADAGVDLGIEVGGELKPESLPTVEAADLQTISHGPRDARWLLYEVPFSGVDAAFLEGAAELRQRGYALLLAHPERSRGLLAGGLEAMGDELRAGARLASNIGPLIGREGPERQAALLHLLERGLVHVLATDAHPPHRPWTLDLARDLLSEGFEELTGTRAADALAQGLPRP